ncbi:MAG TPA: transglutaminaseTgpA domain-containing protein [Nocardioidaceae bacterium]|nr:transglutaminaseTgpA domain-containing protein [Nocardioidaceae bacterium]
MIRRVWSEQVRVTFWAWVATLCAAAMLAPLTSSKRYLVIGAIGAAAVSITGALLRSRRAHVLVVLLAELVVALEWLVLTFARSEAFLGFIPGPDAISELRSRWSDYADFANQYAAPLPQNPNVTMAMATVVVGLAVVVDVVAASWRRASLLGLVFLAVYMTPVSILGGEISILAFLIGALGYVFLLAADERERLTHWGRQISTAGSLWDRPTEVDEGGLRRNGTRVGLGAIAMAAVVPVLVPTLAPHYFGTSGSGGPGSGSTFTDQNPVLDLQRDLLSQNDAPLMKVTTDDPTPEYFQLAVLDEFTGQSWTVGSRSPDDSVPASGVIPLPNDIDATTQSNTYQYDVTIENDFDTRWLPLRYVPTSIHIDQPWSVSRTNYDAYSNDSASGQSYSFTSNLYEPTIGQMVGAQQSTTAYENFLWTPTDLPAVFHKKALNVTAGQTTWFGKARALQNWFRNGQFRYSLNVPALPANRNIDDLVKFLTTDKIGYCEQFATSMAIMARTLNIPSRVVIGFLQPEHVEGNTWVFKGTDLHAWPELHFQGAGWVRFEPTPETTDSAGSQPLRFTSGGPTAPTASGTNATPNVPTGKATESAAHGANVPSSGQNGTTGRGSTVWWSGPSILLGALVLLSVPWLTRTWIRRRRWSRARGPAETAQAAWDELRDHVIDLRMDWDSGATPRAIGRSLRERLPEDRQVVPALNHLVLAIEQARYARTMRPAEGLREAEVVVAEALSSRQTAGRRFLARWLPASLLRSRRRRTRPSERLGELLVSVEK